MGYFVQAPQNWKGTPAQEASPLQQTIELRLKRSVGEGMLEEVQLTNYTQVQTRVQLELDFKPEFVAPDEAGGERKQHGSLASSWREPTPGTWELELRYDAKHHFDHQGN